MQIVDRILQSSQRASARTVESVLMHLVEEVGEVAKAINRPKLCDEPVEGEIADVLNCAIDLLYVVTIQRLADGGMEITEDVERSVVEDVKEVLTYYTEKKCAKWDSQKGE